MQTFKKISLITIILFYLLTGTNHFRNPAPYLNIIPPYIPYPSLANVLAGSFEVLLALMLIFPRTRRLAAWGIILMLAVFLPVHISMIGDAPLKLGNLIVTPLIGWIRLVILRPLLIPVGMVVNRGIMTFKSHSGKLYFSQIRN